MSKLINKNALGFALMVVVVMFVFSQPAHAYINPGSGSDFFQMFASIFLSIGAFFKSIFGKVASGFKKGSDNDYE